MGIKHFDCDVLSTGFLDESGDSGMKGTKCLVLTYICTNEGKRIGKILKRAKEQLRTTKNGQRWLNRLGGEIKFNSFPDQHLLMKTIEDLAKLKLGIRFVAIYKENHDITESEKESILTDLLKDHILNKKCMPKKIIADKDYFKNKKIAYLIVRNYEGINYGDEQNKEIESKISFIEEEEKQKIGDCNLILSIKHENSKLHPELQAVDLISGSIFQEMEKNDKTYTDIIRKYAEIYGRINKPQNR